MRTATNTVNKAAREGVRAGGRPAYKVALGRGLVSGIIAGVWTWRTYQKRENRPRNCGLSAGVEAFIAGAVGSLCGLIRPRLHGQSLI